MSNWNYAELAHKAKGYGGPEQMIAIITRDAEIKGELKGATVVVGAYGLWHLGNYVYKKIVDKINESQEIKEELIEKIKSCEDDE